MELERQVEDQTVRGGACGVDIHWMGLVDGQAVTSRGSESVGDFHHARIISCING